ncbi:GSCFA domain-containing protein [Chromohalobacter canadensis]|uniref:GSCFA domain-containing protein n=1 Tax=Chromohalobacter canadensis TaxID=141389 RepID=UPI0021C15189|nr:GSCFA domain-containing protein [Chromohalobacter canadensis]MCT8469813.1 GSCFA domain-containing protein [Chromohalobacter canadensis]MCT8472352.1 GSCFA domain-containing protein [Chromohalobacter canadensis]MCT8499535.1 GSCFA domain-containing protein [Chromohalobacter canadensis]
MMKWTTFIKEMSNTKYYSNFFEPSFSIPENSKIFTIGSCFARNIEDRLSSYGHSFPIKGYQATPGEYTGQRGRGILNKFTPLCMLEELLWLTSIKEKNNFERETYERFYFPVKGGYAIDLGLQQYKPVPLERFFNRRKNIYSIYNEMSTSDVIVLTLGLIEQWLYNGKIAQHAPNNKATIFEKENFSFSTLSTKNTYLILEKIEEAIKNINPTAKIIFTVSPVPLEATFTDKHVAVANQLSKSTLLIAAHEIAKKRDIDYFPSFEIVGSHGNLAYESDLRHVKDSIVSDICKIFHEEYTLKP